MANPPTNLAPPNRAPLKLVLLITFLGSMGTAVVTNGIAFIADQGLNYTSTQNLLLALVLGASYVPAALLSGPLLRRAKARFTSLTTKKVLIAIMLLLTLVAQGPLLVEQLNPHYTELSIWIMGIVFMNATGIQWPIIEAYLSGGRTAKSLRSAIGKFNIVWSSALVLAYWLMAPMIQHHPFLIVSLLGAIHLLIAGLVCWLPSESSKTRGTGVPPVMTLDSPKTTGQRPVSPQPDEPHPEVYVPLLMVFRMMLIASYVILSVMIPLMPSIEAKLHLSALWWTPIASTWLIVRVLVFILLERWHGWHGHWWTPWLGMSAMILGFAVAMLAPMIGDSQSIEVNSIGVLILVAGLSLAGIGIAATYYGALYYAMAVGGSEIDSGGKHEALIGVGYTVGPLCGLIGGFIYQGGLGVIGVTSVVVLTMVGVAVYKATTR